jgi:phosphoribosylanthranilate isomerase
MTKIKICGIRRLEDVHLMNKYHPDYVGFVLAPSKRRVSLEEVRALASLLAPTISKVGVFVNETHQEILSFVKEDLIDYIQLHGDEDRAYVQALQKELALLNKDQVGIIQAIRIKDEKSIVKANKSIAQYILLDKYDDKSYGGLGEAFDWSLLEGLRRPYFLAGGIGQNNLQRALAYKPYALDLSSKLERQGVKDEILIAEFMVQKKKEEQKWTSKKKVDLENMVDNIFQKR